MEVHNWGRGLNGAYSDCTVHFVLTPTPVHVPVFTRACVDLERLGTGLDFDSEVRIMHASSEGALI